MQQRIVRAGWVSLAVWIGALAPAAAGSHTWDVFELFSNADGTVQFIELWEANGTAGETGVGGHNLTSNSSTFLIPSNVASPTTNKFLLFATAGFAALPGAPTPDHIIPSNFVALGGDSISYVPWDTLAFGSGLLPTDGLHSLKDGLTTGVATPTNYAGQSWSAPPAVPDGSSGPPPLLVNKALPDGSRLSLTWDAANCLGAIKHQVVYGFGSQLPSSLGGVYGLQTTAAAQCNLVGSTKIWSAVPDPATDSTRFLWFLVLATNGGATEGSWGRDSAGSERTGPAGGDSGQCGVTTKNLANTCGL